MGSLNIKNIPEKTRELLKKQAEINHRSLNQEVLHILEGSVGHTTSTSPDPHSLLARVRETQKKFKGMMTLEEMDQAKREARP